MKGREKEKGIKLCKEVKSIGQRSGCDEDSLKVQTKPNKPHLTHKLSYSKKEVEASTLYYPLIDTALQLLIIHI